MSGKKSSKKQQIAEARAKASQWAQQQILSPPRRRRPLSMDRPGRKDGKQRRLKIGPLSSNNENERTVLTSTAGSVNFLFLRGLSCIFCIAFASYYVQFPGLLSEDGLLPVSRVFPGYFPSYLSEYLDGQEDAFCELVALAGIIVSVIAFWIPYAIFYLFMTGFYIILVVTGQEFYSFQWDVLLIETGFITVLFYAPLFNISNEGMNPWPLRFLLFKLMFMSGVVKVQSRCPTWLNLTALEYHFATQCIPGPLSWYAHQLHPLFLRLGVAATFIIEIFASFMLIVPLSLVRQVGAYLQIILQSLIICTGNYNFFNILTILLCLPCLDANEEWTILPYKYNKKKKQFDLMWKLAQGLLSITFLLWISLTTFKLQKGKESEYQLSFLLNVQDVNKLSNIMVPASMYFVFALSLLSFFEEMKSRKRILKAVKGLIGSYWILLLALPMLGMTSTLRTHQLPVGTLAVYRSYELLYALRAVNSYGLFRTMTGVGQSSCLECGWGGNPPSIVARPEIILEVQSKKGEWKELRFRWKPGDLDQLPIQVAPYQPRLDWQMWFAALGRYQYNPWFINLVRKLLEANTKVSDLLAEPDLEGIKSIRAQLYSYDFTRKRTKWAERLPTAEVEFVNFNDRGKKIVWSRKHLGLYFPPTESDGDSLLALLDHYGLSAHPRQRLCKPESPCSLSKTAQDIRDIFDKFYS